MTGHPKLRTSGNQPKTNRSRRIDPVRRLAYRVLRAVTSTGAYANLKLAQALHTADFDRRDAAFATELVAGTSRMCGTYDVIIQAAAGRDDLDDEVREVLRLIAHQVLSMRVPTHAAISTGVELATAEIGPKVTGLVNAVGRKLAAYDLDSWLAELTTGMSEPDALGLRTHHPRWIVDAFADVLPAEELAAALNANNLAPIPNLVVRPGLATVADLVFAGATPNQYSRYGAAYHGGRLAELAAVRAGRAGVQDEGSQLVTLALAAVAAPSGPWLDLCAGPGGKAALLGGLAAETGTTLVASEIQFHRAELVQQALRGYPVAVQPIVVVADGINPPYPPGSFAKVMVDAPCTGLGALRRRPESRWRRQPTDVADLVSQQRALLASAIELTMPQGVIGYVTCSPHRAETEEIIESVDPTLVEVLSAVDYLPDVPDVERGERFVQLWPHRHGTDAMFLALLRRRSS